MVYSPVWQCAVFGAKSVTKLEGETENKNVYSFQQNIYLSMHVDDNTLANSGYIRTELKIRVLFFIQINILQLLLHTVFLLIKLYLQFFDECIVFI